MHNFCDILEFCDILDQKIKHFIFITGTLKKLVKIELEIILKLLCFFFVSAFFLHSSELFTTICFILSNICFLLRSDCPRLNLKATKGSFIMLYHLALDWILYMEHILYFISYKLLFFFLIFIIIPWFTELFIINLFQALHVPTPVPPPCYLHSNTNVLSYLPPFHLASLQGWHKKLFQIVCYITRKMKFKF